MRVGRYLRKCHRGIAWLLIMACALPQVWGSGMGTLKVQAEEGIEEYSNDLIQNKDVLVADKNRVYAINTYNELLTWGHTSNISDEEFGTRLEPVKILEDVRSVTPGSTYANLNKCMAIKTDNSLWAGDKNNFVKIMEDVRDVYWNNGFDNIMLVKTDGSLWEEGDYNFVKIMNNVKKVAIEGNTRVAMVLKTDGSLWTWGYDENGLLGQGEGIESCDEPTKIMDNVKEVEMSSYSHAAVIKADGSLWMWGKNGRGQIGNGQNSYNKPVYTPVEVLGEVKRVVLANGYSAAIKTDGSLWMWGDNTHYQLGCGHSYTSNTPTKIIDAGVREVSLGNSVSAAIKTDNSLWTWGSNVEGSLGNGGIGCTHGITPDMCEPYNIMKNVWDVCISDALSFGAVVKTDGSLWMWGNNQTGSLGNGTTDNSLVPIQTLPPGSIKVSGGGNTDTDPDSDAFDISVKKVTGPQIEVDELVDGKAVPVAGATVTYNEKEFTTSESGRVTLDNYKSGKKLTITKEGYIDIEEEQFVKDRHGKVTYYKLWNETDDLNAIFDEVLLRRNSEDNINVLVEDAQINIADNENFAISCSSDVVNCDKLELYVGDEKIADTDDNCFWGLNPKQFSSGKPVYLYIYRGTKCIKKRLRIYTTCIREPFDVLPIADDAPPISIEEDVPVVGGQELRIEVKDVPISWNINSNGKIKAIINLGEIITDGNESFDELFSRVKRLNKENASEFIETESGSVATKKIKPKFNFIGYLESNVNTPDYLEGKLWVAVSVEGKSEKQLSLGPVPVVAEMSIEGSLRADGTFVWKAQEGINGAIGVGGSANIAVYGGVGVEKVANFGVYGKALFNLHYNILPEDIRGVDNISLSGEIGVRGEVVGLKHTAPLIERSISIIPGEKKDKAASGQRGDGIGWQAFALDDYDAYESLNRNYLNADGGMDHWMADNEAHINGNAGEVDLQSTAYSGSVPQVVRMGDTVMLFYLTDAGTVRDEADRSKLVYSLWDNSSESWSEPTAVLAEDDGTADFNPDFYSDGKKIYAVWQDAEESLKGLTLTERVKRLTLHAAVYDVEKKQFKDLGKIVNESGGFQQDPQIVADDNGVSVYWYENAQDNVLGLSGTNRIYRASLTDQTILTEGLQVMSVSEEGTEAQPVFEEPEAEESDSEKPDGEKPETEESVSDNTMSTFRKFVALTEEETVQETLVEKESVSENTTPEDEGENADGEENNTPPVNPGEENEEENREPEEEETEKPETEESVSENTVPEETISENTISGNSIQANATDIVIQADQPWIITFVQEEADCIVSADAGRINGKSGYGYAAGTLSQSYDMKTGKVTFLESEKDARVLKNGQVGNVEFYAIYGEETLTWYEAGDIGYVDGSGETKVLFGESRLPSGSYKLLSDGTSPEVLFSVYIGGKANLYRISHENGAFLPSLQVTDQEDYIQSVDGFVKDGRTILVYNKVKVDEELEVVNNSLCTGTIMHSYYDIAIQSAGAMILPDKGSEEDILDVRAQLYNNGTIKAENLSLSLCDPDGTILQTVPVDIALEPGKTGRVSAVFSPDNITKEAEYKITVSGAEETNKTNNSTPILLGNASLQIDAELFSLDEIGILQVGILNTGVTECGGTVSVQDAENGTEYCRGTFEPVAVGTTALAEVKIDPVIFATKDIIPLKVVVIPDREEAGTVSDFVTAFASSYEVSFVTDTGTTTAYVNYGRTAVFPENPTKDGTYFAGWYDSQTPGTGTVYTENTPIKQDVTLYAHFVEEETAISIENCSVSEIPEQFYTGGAIKPKVTVKWGSQVLKANKDYSVAYKNNKNQGKATVMITGKGNYTGSIERSFSIMYPTNKVSVKAIPAVNFTGEAHTPTPVVTYQKKTLVKDRDYTVSYFNNRNAGTAGVTLTGKGTFSGTKTVTFQIRGTAISGMKFDKIPDVTYNGRNTRPIVTVKTKDGKTQLMSGSDYRLVYENTVNKGTATVTVIGNGNYTGTKKLTYKVVAKPLAESMVSVEQPSASSLVVAPEKAEYTYTGKPIKPVLTVTDEAAGDTALVLNKDYTVSYSKNKAVGEAQITIKGKGNYSGTLKIPFTIKPVNLAEAETEGTIDVRVNDIAYTGKALKPAVQVYETVDGKDRKLSGSAYTLSYANNTEKGTGTVTVTGKEKSGYTGTVTANFRIVDKAKLLSASAIKIDAISAQTFTGSAVEPALHIVDKSDKNNEVTLEKGTHYEVAYRNNVNAGKATVTVRGIGSYAGSRDVTFKINKCAIADKNVLGAGFTVENPADMKYTGYALKPDVVIKDKGATLVQGKDYKLSYKNNTKIGTASVTAQGIGNYSGSYKAISFQITAWDYNTLTAEMEGQTYTGRALKPQVTFYMTGENGREKILLKPNTAFKIVYKDNKNAGTATATITGKGELDKITPITVTFEIEQADLSEAVVSRIPNQTLKGAAVKPIPKVKVGKNSLKAGRDFTTSYLRNGVKGEATVIISGVGNYTGECRKTFIVQ